MSIFQPEIAALCGLLDSDGFIDGAGFSAHHLRAMIRTANRLSSKEQLLFDLAWSEAINPDTGVTGFEGVAPLQWTRVLPAVPVKKRPNLNEAEVYLRMAVPSGQTVEVFVASSRRPWGASRGPSLTITGTGAFVDHTVSGVPVSPGEDEAFELWIRGVPTTTLADTATYGAPNTRASAPPGLFDIRQNGSELYLTSATWNNSGLNSLAAGGHWIRFEDAAGEPVGPARLVVGHYANQSLLFSPSLSLREQVLVDVSGAGEWSIFELARYQIAQFAGWAMGTNGAGLIAPYHGHPHAPASGKALANALRAARVYRRTHARRIGNQPYSNRFRDPALDLSGGHGIYAGTWVDVARFDHAMVPSIAGSVRAHLSWHLAQVEPTRMHLRVLVTDGVNTDTGLDGAPPEIYYEPQPNPGLARQAFTVWPVGDPCNGETVAEVELVDARVVSGVAARTVTVQAYATGATDRQKFQPGIVTAWWEAH